LDALRAKAAAFPGELTATVDKSVKDAIDKLKLEAKNREDLLAKVFEGERNVLTTRLESLEKMAKDLSDQNGRLGKQLEAAYQKVQEIAEKTIESAGQSRSLADLQKLLVDQGRKTGEK
jgi:hypothetical protein